jgi:hypothetical protein
MRLRFAGQVPKDSAFPDANEDALNVEIELGRVAVSDGASESFDSRTWASILASRFVQCPELTEAWLSEALGDYASRFDPANLSWSKQAAFERGSFATLLGLEQSTEYTTVDVIGIGDTVAVLVGASGFIDSHPYGKSEQFQQRPELFCTNPVHNAFFTTAEFFLRHHKTWSLNGMTAAHILCMTDALADWAFRNAEAGQPVWDQLIAICDAPALEALVQRERQTKAMRVDDTTLVTISLEDLCKG